MINETDLLEYYELLEKKKEEWEQNRQPLLMRQIELLQELIKIQSKLLGVRL